MAKETTKEDVLEKSLKSLRQSVDMLDEDLKKEISFGRSFLLAIVR
jgi:hypothetical protein